MNFQETFMDIMVGNGLACRDVVEAKDYSSLEAGWTGEDWKQTCIANMQLLLGVFVPDKEKLRRLQAAYYMVPAVFADLARLEYHITGKPVHIPQALIKEFQKRLLVALEPSVREIVEQSEYLMARPAGIAAREMRHLITEKNGWHIKR